MIKFGNKNKIAFFNKIYKKINNLNEKHIKICRVYT